MRSFSLLVFVLVVIGSGVALGVGGRAWLDRQQGPDPTAVPVVVVTPAPASVPAAKPPAAGDVVVEVTESELQNQLAAMLVGRSLGTTPLGDATVESVTVALRDRQVQVGGAAQAGVVRAPFSAAGTIVPAGDGRARVTVSEAKVGGVAVPEAARSSLAKSLQSQVDTLFAARSFRVRSVDIADGKLRLVGTVES